MLSLEQRIEGMEEFFLRMLFAGEELNVVDQQRIQRAIGGLELVDAIVLQRSNHIAHEALGVHVGDLRGAIARQDQMPDRVHQMSFAEADSTVDEQRVVGAPRIARDLKRGGLGEMVALAFDEIVESEFGIERHADRRCGPRRARR